MQTITNNTADTAEQDSWQEWADREGDWQEARDKRRADAEAAEIGLADEDAEDKAYRLWLMQSAFRDVTHLVKEGM